MRAISLFSGAGGFDSGAKMAGIDVLLAVEHDEQACDTFAANHPAIPLHRGDVRDIDWGDYLSPPPEGAINPHNWVADIDVVFGGPPCQPFSCAANGSRGQSDTRDMVPEFLRCVREVKPMFFVMENVPSLAAPRHKKYFSSVLAQMEEMGYAVSHRVLDASKFGVCQKRRRLFVIGVLGGPAVDMPALSLCRRPSLEYYLHVCIQPVGFGPAVIYAKNPVLRRSVGGSLLVNGRGKPITKLSNTITAGSGNGRHIIDPGGVLQEYHKSLHAGGPVRTGRVEGVRRMSFMEATLVQDFPWYYDWRGSSSSRWRQVGNAVPPRLACAVLGMLEVGHE